LDLVILVLKPWSCEIDLILIILQI
jgi:hypothetical protein